jgi:hypothetical protein
MEFVGKETIATGEDKNIDPAHDIPTEVYVEVTNERIDVETRDVDDDSRLSKKDVESEDQTRRSFVRKSGMALYQQSLAMAENRQDC